MTTDRDQVRQAIQDQYGARAKRAGGEPAVGPDGDTGLVQLEMVGGDAADGAACCGDDCCVPQGLADGDRNLIKGFTPRTRSKVCRRPRLRLRPVAATRPRLPRSSRAKLCSTSVRVAASIAFWLPRRPGLRAG